MYLLAAIPFALAAFWLVVVIHRLAALNARLRANLAGCTGYPISPLGAGQGSSSDDVGGVFYSNAEVAATIDALAPGQGWCVSCGVVYLSDGCSGCPFCCSGSQGGDYDPAGCAGYPISKSSRRPATAYRLALPAVPLRYGKGRAAERFVWKLRCWQYRVEARTSGGVVCAFHFFDQRWRAAACMCMWRRRYPLADVVVHGERWA